MARKKTKQSQSLPLIEELDSRTLFSADIEGLLVTDLSPQTDNRSISESLTPNTATASEIPSKSSPDELVIVDTNTPDYQTLIDDLVSNTAKGHVIEFVLLDSSRNGIEQISEILADQQDLDAVHIISHGSDGSVQLGNSQLDNDSLFSYSESIASWGTAFSDSGDLLFYGCNLAATENGQSLIDSVAQLTAADVAASDDLTGTAELGGDWDLEYQAGTVEVQAIINPDLKLGWAGVLDTSSNLVAHWKFDDAQGAQLTDSSINNNEGTPKVTPISVTGHIGSNALSFNGDFDRVEVYDHASLDFGSGDFSVSLWFKSTQSDSGIHDLIMKGSGANIFGIFSDGGTIHFSVKGGGVVTGPLTQGGLFDDNWHHVVGTRNANLFTLYVDNVAVATDTTAVGSVDSSDKLLIGASSATGGDYDGSIDDVRLYNRALSAGDVSALHTGNAAPTNLTLSQATPIAITNAGFETNVLADGDDGFILPGWTGAAAIAGEWNPPVTDYPDEAPEGENVGFIDTSFGGHEVYQDLAETFEAGRDYTLSAMIGDKLDTNDSSGWRMLLIAGNQSLGEVTNTDFNPANGEFIKATLHLDAETLETYSTEYGSTLRIQFENIGNPVTVNDAHFDDVQLEYTSISVSDNAANGTVVADVSSVTDPDAGDTHTFTLLDNASGRFTIDNSTGVITVANGALLNYANNSNHSITIQTTDSASLAYTKKFTIQVRQPLHNIANAQTTNEDNDLFFNTANSNLISINDPGLSNDSLYTTLSVSNGTLTLSQITGLSFTTGTGSADASMTFTGSLANINAALDGMKFTPMADYNGATSLQLTTFDDAGLLGAYSFDAAANLGADDGPGTANDGTVSGATQATGTNRGNVLNFVDNTPNDAVTVNGVFGSPANVTLSAWIDFTKATEVPNGKADVISLGDAVVLRVGGTGSGSLDGVIGFFYDGTNWNEIEFNTPISGTGWHHVAYTFDDTTDTQKLYFDGIEVASGANTTSISYTSPATAGGTISNTTIGTHADPDEDQFAFVGNIDDARVYDYALTAQDIVTIKNTPPGKDSDTVSITINAANDAPTLTANALNPTYTENDENAVSVFDTAIVSTIETGQQIDELIFTISNVTGLGLERINLDGSTFFLANGVSGTTVNTSYDYSVSLSGSTATVVMTTTGASTTQITNLIHSIEYKNSSEDPTTADRVITITSIKDDGGTANGGSNTTSPNIASTVTVIAVNDAPDIDTTLTERTPLNTPLLFSTSNSNAITLSDVDIGSGNAEVTLNVTNGTLSLASISNLSFSAGTGTTDTSMTFSGKLIDINAALNGLQYSPTTGFSGSSTLQIVANDLGNSGSGTSFTDSTSIFIGVSNTTPVATNDPGEYNSEIVTLNPVSNWRLGESSGTTLADNGSAAATGTVNGATLGQPGALNGSSNTAANFDGTDDYIEIPHTSDFLLDNGTIQLWFNADTVGTKQSLFSKDHNTFGTGGHLSIWLTDSGTLQVRLQDTAISHYVESSSIVTTGQWHHVAFSFGANGMELYLDGKIIDVNGYTGGLGTTSGGTGNIESIVLGTTNSKSTQGTVDNLVNYFQGAIDEVSITGNQLNGELIKDIYASGVQHYTLVENTSLTIPSSAGVLINDTDEDGDAITAVLVNGPIFASSFTLNPNGSFDYTPNAGFNGTDSFTYQASDGGNDSNIATATITVTGSNDAPTVNPTASDTGTEDTDVVYTHAQMLSLVGGTDPDDTNDFLSIAITNVVNGTLVSTGSGTGTTFTFTPTLNFVGNMTFDYQVSDDTPAASTTGTATVAISAVNDLPVATANTVSTSEDTAHTFTLSEFHFTDIESHALASVSLSNLSLAGGTLEHSGGTTVTNGATLNFAQILTLIYTPANNANGLPLATFDFTVNDTGTGVVAAQMSINVTAVNDAPTINATASDTGTEDTDTVYTHPQMLTLTGAADVDDVDADLSIAITNVTNGTLVMTGGTGGAGTTFTFTPTLNFVGNMTFDYQVSDDTPAASTTGAATVSISAVNDAPTINAAASDTGTEDTDTVYTHAQMLTLTGAADVDDVDVDLSIAITNVANGTLVMTGGTGGAGTTFTFTPTLNFVGNLTFDYQVSDDTPAASTTGTATTSLSAVNDRPIALANLVTTNEDTPHTFSVGTFTYTDIESDTLISVSFSNLSLAGGTLEHSSGTSVTNGATLTAAEIATLIYTPANNANGLPLATFDFTVNDTDNGIIAAQMRINVNAVNDAPEVDLNGVSAGIDYSTTFIEGGGAINLTSAGVSLIDSDNVILNSIIVTLTNRLDPASKESLSASTGSTPLSATWSSATDTLTISPSGSPPGNLADYLSVLSTVQYNNTSNNPDLSTRTVTFVANDGTDTSVLATTTINMSAVNDEPVTDPASASGSEDDASISITLAGSDVDGTVQSFSLSNLPANGILYTDVGLSSAAATGTDYAASGESLTLYFVPASNWNGVTTFQFAAKDDLGLVDTTLATSTITVSPVNDAPVATVPAATSLTEFLPYTFSTDSSNLISIADIDSGSNSVEVTLTATNGLLTLFGSTATLSFTTGDGSNDSVMTFTGSQADINTALDGMTFISTTNHGGTGSLQVNVNDLGNNGAGNVLTDSKSIAITILEISGGTLTGDEFLQGNFIEVGISSDGAIGSNSGAPAGFVLNGQKLGVITDRNKDGWATGTPNYDGDHVLQGTHEEGWGLRINGTNYNNNNINVQEIAGDLGSVIDTGAEQSVLWSGGVDGINVLTTHQVEQNGQFIEFQVTLTNTTASALTDVYYMRNADPDNNQQTSAEGFTTTNSIISQGNDGSGIARVEAGQSDGSYLGLVGFGSNARVTHGGFSNRNPVDVFDGTGGLNASGTFAADQAISLAFKFDTIAAGETVTLRYQYIVNDPVEPGIDLDLDGSSGAPGPDFLTTFTEGGSAVNITDIDAIVFDPDSANLDSMTVTLTNQPDGILETLSAITVGTSINASYNSGTGILTLSNSDTLAHYQQVFRSITYNNTSLSPDTTDRTIAITADDGSNTSSIATSVINIVSTNDAPVNTAPASIAVTEDLASPLTGLSIADSDAGSGTMLVTLSVPSGTLAAASSGGVVVGGSSSALTLSGNVTAINAFIAASNVTYTTALNANNSVNLTLLTSDQGNTGTGGTLTDTDIISLTVTPVNDAPLATNLTTTSSYTEGAASVAITDIVVSDVDTGESITATLTLANTATGSLSSNDGAIYTSGNGEWTITGSVSAVNTALANLAFTPLTDNDLDTSIAVSIDDGDEDTSGPLTGTITLDVAPVNDAPLATNLTTTSSYTEGAASVAITDIVVSDVDTGESITATLTLANTATGSLSSNDGAIYTSGNGEWTITGSVSAVNTALANLAFTPLTDNDLDTSIAVSIDDGDEDTSGPLTGTITLDVAPVNDAPLATNLTTTSSYTEGAASVAITDIVVSDVDTGESITATLTLANTATGSLSATDGATYTAGVWTITDSVANVNTALANLTFTPLTDNDLDTTIAVSIDDGDEDTSGPLTGTITLDVAPVNDAPLATNLTTTSSYTEGAASVAITDIVVSDVDTGEIVTATLTLANTATGSLSATDGATYTAGVWTITDSVANVNTALANLTFTPLTDNDLDTTIAVSIDDGDEDTSGPLTGTITLDVAPVNDAPLATNLTTTSSYTEGAASVAITDIVVSDVDTGESITATLTLTNTATGSLSATGGATYTAGVWTITDSVANVNTALANLTFTPLTDNDLDTTIAVSIDDGDEDTSGPLTGTITLDVAPVNDAPLATNLTTTSSYTEGAASVAITDIVVSDVDTGEIVTATLTLANTATGSLSATDGATYTAGVWTITDSVANVNTALANLTFTPLTDNDLDTTIAVSIDDGDEDTSGPLTGTITLDVAPVNDAPLATNLTTTSSYTEGAASVAITDIVVSDVDTGEIVTATLTLANTATGSLSATDGATYTAGVWTITDSVANVNTALANLTFTPLTDNDLDTTIAVSIDDGDEDTSGPLTGTITLDVAPVNDAPLATNLTTTSSYTEGAASVAITDIVVSDVDTGESITATLTLTNTATGSLSATGGATYTAGVWTITDSVANVNTALANLTFTPLTDNDLDTTIAVSIDDGDEDTSGPLTGTITLDVAPVNDAPLATNLTTTSSYTEGAASVAITDIVVSDVDTGEIVTATLTLANTATGSLSATDGATYTAGVWTITDSVANVNTALANLTFTPLTDNDLDTTIAVSIDDGDEDTSGPLTGTITLDVAPVNDAPLATNLTTTSSYTEGAASVAITDIVVSDVDTGEIVTATLTLANTATGSLSATDGATYTAGVWTITDSVANVNTALANLTFTPLTDNDLDTTIAVSIDDGDEDTSGPLTGTITLDVAPVNDAPLATNLTTTSSYTEGAASVAITDIVVSDVDTGEIVTATLTLANTATGSLSATDGATYTAGVWTITDSVANVNTALANLTFTPLTDNDLDTTIAVSIDDGDEDTSGPLTGTITLDVAPVNDAPLATNLTTTSSYTEGAASVAITDIVVSDVDTGEIVTATLTLANTATGSLSATDGATYTAGVWTITDSVANVNTALANLTFTPLTDNDLDTTIAVSIDDGDEDTSGPLTGTITLDVAPVNDAPLATNLTTTSSYTEGAASVAITDIVVSDVDTGEIVTATLTLANTATGSLSATDGATYTAGVWTITDSVANVNTALANLTFTPLTDNDLDTTIAVSIDDGDEDTSGPLTGTITLDVAPVNDAPLATNLTTTSSYTEGAASVAITDIVVSDVDTGEIVTATLTLANTATGSLSATDGATYTAGVWTITDSVANVNTALANLTFTPLTDNDLDTTIAVSIDDGDEDTSGPLTGTITLDVAPVNDAPLATNLTTTSSYTEGAASVAITDIVVSDVDTGEIVTATLTLANTATGSLSATDGATYTAGVWTITDSVANVNTALANLTFTPLTDNDLDTTIAVSIDDGDEDTSGPLTGTITLDVAPVNDAPLATNLTTTSSYTEGAASVAITDIVVSDVDTGESITATLTLTNTATGSLSANDSANYNSGNGEWTITGAVSTVNTALANLTFTPLTDNDLDTTIAVSIDDGDEDTSGPLTGTITLDVAPVNDAPAGTDNTFTLDEDTLHLFTAGDFGFSDPIEGHSLLAVRITTLPTNGTLIVNGNPVSAGDFINLADINAGQLLFMPVADANGTPYSSFTFQVQDDGGVSSGGIDLDPVANTLTFNVTPVNDAPIAANDSYSVDEDSVISIPAATGLLANDSDIDPDPLTVLTTPVSGPANGILTLNADGAFTYTPNADFNGTDSFIYQITDSQGAFATAQVTLIVVPTNDDPIITLPTASATTPGGLIVYSIANGNAITISDIDGPGEDFQISLTISGGTLTLGSTTGLTFMEGNGDGDNTLIFSGKIYDINAALDGLALTPNSGFFGQTSLVMTTINLNDPAIPPAEFINTVNIDVSAPPIEPELPVGLPSVPLVNEPLPPVREIDDIGPGVELIIDDSTDTPSSHGDLSPSEPEEPEPEIEPEPTPPVQEQPPLIPEVVTEIFEKVEEITDEVLASVLNPVDVPDTFLGLTDQTVMWRSIDSMLDDLDEAFAEEEQRNNILAYGLKGTTWSLSAGFVAWALRGGSLLATAMSSIPIWRGLDPLPILAMTAKDRKKQEKLKQQELREEDDLQKEIGELIDGAKLKNDKDSQHT